MHKTVAATRVGAQPERLLAMLERLLAIGPADSREALSQALLLVTKTLSADRVDAFGYQPDTEGLAMVETSDKPNGQRPGIRPADWLLSASHALAEEVFRTGELCLVGRTTQDLAGESPGELVVHSAIAAPWEIAGERRGVLVAIAARPNLFSEADLRFLEAVCRWVEIVFQRAEYLRLIDQATIERQQRVAAEEMITMLAHDLRNRLTPLKGRIDLIRWRMARENRVRDVEDIDEAASSVDGLIHFVSDLLDIDRLERGVFSVRAQPVDLSLLARETAEAHQTRSTEIRVQAPARLLACADPVRIRQALSNLLANAIRHSPPGMPVVVEVAEERDLNGPWAVLRVIDQGSGIHPDLLPHLFNRFAAGPGSPGLGLGLYLASRIAVAHGGTLSVDSTPGAGACFQLCLPVAGEECRDEGTA